MTPDDDFKAQSLMILRYDDAFLFSRNLEAYVDNKDNYTKYPWLTKGWTVPFVTGHKYKIHWGTNGIDWTQMEVRLSEKWTETDKSIHFVHNFTAVREKFDVSMTTNHTELDLNTAQFADDTIDALGDETKLKIGNNKIYPENDVR